MVWRRFTQLVPWLEMESGKQLFFLLYSLLGLFSTSSPAMGLPFIWAIQYGSGFPSKSRSGCSPRAKASCAFLEVVFKVYPNLIWSSNLEAPNQNLIDSLQGVVWK